MNYLVKKIKKYGAMISIGMKDEFESPARFLWGLLMMCFTTWLIVTIFQGILPHTDKGSMMLNILWVLALTRTVDFASRGKLHASIPEDIQSGQFAIIASKPFSYMFFLLSTGLGKSIPSIIIYLTVIFLESLFLIGIPDISFFQIVQTIPLILLGVTMFYLMSLCISVLAFWLEDTRVVFWILTKSILVFGGTMIPLSFYPSQLQEVVLRLPFILTYNAPINVLFSMNPMSFMDVLLLQLFWIFVFILLLCFLYSIGRKNVTSYGG